MTSKNLDRTNTNLAQQQQQQPQRNDNTMQRNDMQQRDEQRRFVAPPVDIFENEDELLLVADMPGVESNDIKIRLDRGELTLEARRASNDQGRALSQDYGTYDYGRRFLVPGTIDPARIEAQLKNGVLFLHLPKAESAKPREIPVRAR